MLIFYLFFQKDFHPAWWDRIKYALGSKYTLFTVGHIEQ